MRLVAVVGMAGSGKSEATRFFVEKGYERIYFGQLTLEELEKQGLEINEQNENLVRLDLRIKHGMDAYAKLNIEKIQKAFAKGNVVIDGLYSWDEYLYLRKMFNNLLHVVCIYASPETRYKRLSEREVRPLSKHVAFNRDVAEIEHIQKAGPIAMADVTLINESSPEELRAELEKVYLSFK